MKPRVLVVDDDAVGRYTLRGLLEEEGLEVDEAADGQIALDKLAGADLGRADSKFENLAGARKTEPMLQARTLEIRLPKETGGGPLRTVGPTAVAIPIGGPGVGLQVLVTLLAAECAQGQPLPIRQAAWYHKDKATFADALTFVRRQIWQHWYFANSRLNADSALKLEADATQLLDALCGST